MNLQVHFVSELQFFVWLVLASLQLGVGGQNDLKSGFWLLHAAALPRQGLSPRESGSFWLFTIHTFSLFPPAFPSKPYLAVPSCPSERFHTGPEGDLNQGFPPAWGENDLTEREEGNHQQFFRIHVAGFVIKQSGRAPASSLWLRDLHFPGDDVLVLTHFSQVVIFFQHQPHPHASRDWLQ